MTNIADCCVLTHRFFHRENPDKTIYVEIDATDEQAMHTAMLLECDMEKITDEQKVLKEYTENQSK